MESKGKQKEERKVDDKEDVDKKEKEEEEKAEKEEEEEEEGGLEIEEQQLKKDKGKQKQEAESPKEADTDFEDTDEDEMTRPLDFGGFLIPAGDPPPFEAPKDTFAREIQPGQAILHNDRSCEITRRTDSWADKGSLNARHTIKFDLDTIFDKERIKPPLVVKATHRLKLLDMARVRYDVVCCLCLCLSLTFSCSPSFQNDRPELRGLS